MILVKECRYAMFEKRQGNGIKVAENVCLMRDIYRLFVFGDEAE